MPPYYVSHISRYTPLFPSFPLLSLSFLFFFSLFIFLCKLDNKVVSDLIADGEGESESGMEAHGELEILLNSLFV
jgi:hypothetical protein